MIIVFQRRLKERDGEYRDSLVFKHFALTHLPNFRSLEGTVTPMCPSFDLWMVPPPHTLVVFVYVYKDKAFLFLLVSEFD